MTPSRFAHVQRIRAGHRSKKCTADTTNQRALAGRARRSTNGRACACTKQAAGYRAVARGSAAC